MRLLIVVLSVLFSVPALAQAPKQVEVINDPLLVEVVNPSPAAVRWQLVGFTSEAVTGVQGPLGFSRMCAADFTDSRWCTSPEVMGTVDPPLLSGNAWVRAHFISEVFDASGFAGSSASFTCGQWSNPGGTHFVTDGESGRFTKVTCSAPLPAACCALVP